MTATAPPSPRDGRIPIADRWFVPGPVHVGRRQYWPTGAGAAVLVSTVLLLGATLPLDDRRPLGVLVGAIVLLAADTLVAVRWLGRPELSTSTPELVSTDEPAEIVVRVEHPADGAVVEVRDWSVERDVPAEGTVRLPVEVRFPTVFHFEALRIGVTGPFGLGRCRRNVSIRSVRPTHVLPPGRPDHGLDVRRLVRPEDDPVDVVGLQEGRAGSPLRDVHWSSSLRTGRLIVRERRPPDSGVLRVAVAVPRTEATRVRQVVGRARAVCSEALDLGARVELWGHASTPPPDDITLDADLPSGTPFLRTAPLRVETGHPVELLRRLASLVPGDVDTPPLPYVLVDVDGARWVER